MSYSRQRRAEQPGRRSSGGATAQRSRYGSRPQQRFQRPTKSKKPAKQYIHHSKFIQAAKQRQTVAYVPNYRFSDFAVDSLIHRNLAAMGFEQPSPIQDQAIPVALLGQDVVGIANTGTGKTAAFAIPVLDKLMHDRTSKVIILAPTRELAQQIEDQCRLIGKGSGLFGVLLIGGVAMGPQIRDLAHNPQIIVGTPGRVKDHIQRGTLDLSNCNLVVLDEVDRMLDMGFVHDITQILSETKADRQSLYFSATLDKRVKGIIDSFSKDPVYISVKQGETSDNVEQDVVFYTDKTDKIDRLHTLLNADGLTKVIIFDDTQRSVERLSKELIARGFSAGSIHGGKTQAQRQKMLDKFKSSHVKVLVSTDVAARGLDVDDISHVVNFSTPQTYDDYVHRIGRTGRANKTGFAYTFVESK